MLDGRPEFRDDIPREISFFFPYANEIVRFPYVFRAIREIGCRAEERRKERLELCMKGLVRAAKLDVIEHIVQDVEDMKTLPLCRWLTMLRQLCLERPCVWLCLCLVGCNRVGKRDEVLPKRCNAAGRLSEVLEDPLLAFLFGEENATNNLAIGMLKDMTDMALFSNLDIGWGAPSDGRIQQREELVNVITGTGCRVCAKEGRRQGSFCDCKIRRRHDSLGVVRASTRTALRGRSSLKSSPAPSLRF